MGEFQSKEEFQAKFKVTFDPGDPKVCNLPDFSEGTIYGLCVSGRISIKLELEDKNQKKTESQEVVLDSKIMIKLNPVFSGQNTDEIRQRWPQGIGLLAMNA